MWEKNSRKEPWRIIAFIISILFIAFMFISKNSAADTGLPAEQALPALVTNSAVTLVKFAAIAGITFIGKHFISKIKNKREE